MFLIFFQYFFKPLFFLFPAMSKDFFRKRYEALGGRIENVKLRKSIRANTLLISNEALQKRLVAKNILLEKIPFLKNGYYADAKFSLGSTPEYLLGLYHLQEAASQIPAEILAPTERDIVLDMCAAPGSKTTQLAQLMSNKGTLVALESKQARAEALMNNLERMHITNCAVYVMDALDSAKLGMKFTKILLDAPCSGNYAGDQDWFGKRDMEGIRKNAAMQQKLLEAAYQVLEKNGTLVYSTCSLEPEENEDNIKWAISYLGFRIEPVCTIGDSLLAGTKCLWPFKTRTQGFFIAKLKK